MAGTPLIVPQHHTQTLLRYCCITLTLSLHLHCPLAKLPLPVFHLDIYRRNLWFLHYLPCFIIGLKLAPHSFAFRRAAHAHRAVSQCRFNYAIQRHSTTLCNNAAQQCHSTTPSNNAVQQRRSSTPFVNTVRRRWSTAVQQRHSATPFHNAIQQRPSTTLFNNAVQKYRATSDHVRRLILRVIKRASSWASKLPWKSLKRYSHEGVGPFWHSDNRYYQTILRWNHLGDCGTWRGDSSSGSRAFLAPRYSSLPDNPAVKPSRRLWNVAW